MRGIFLVLSTFMMDFYSFELPFSLISLDYIFFLAMLPRLLNSLRIAILFWVFSTLTYLISYIWVPTSFCPMKIESSSIELPTTINLLTFLLTSNKSDAAIFLFYWSACTDCSLNDFISSNSYANSYYLIDLIVFLERPSIIVLILLIRLFLKSWFALFFLSNWSWSVGRSDMNDFFSIEWSSVAFKCE